MERKEYTTPEIFYCDLRTEGLMDDHTAALQTGPRVSSTAPGQGSDLDDDDEIAAKSIREFAIWGEEWSMIRLPHQSEVMGARTYFYREMMRNHMEDVLKCITPDLLGVRPSGMIALCTYMYGLIGQIVFRAK